MSALLSIHALSKSFGGFAALTDVSLEVAQGEAFPVTVDHADSQVLISFGPS